MERQVKSCCKFKVCWKTSSRERISHDHQIAFCMTIYIRKCSRSRFENDCLLNREVVGRKSYSFPVRNRKTSFEGVRSETIKRKKKTERISVCSISTSRNDCFCFEAKTSDKTFWKQCRWREVQKIWKKVLFASCCSTFQNIQDASTSSTRDPNPVLKVKYPDYDDSSDESYIENTGDIVLKIGGLRKVPV